MRVKEYTHPVTKRASKFAMNEKDFMLSTEIVDRDLKWSKVEREETRNENLGVRRKPREQR